MEKALGGSTSKKPGFLQIRAGESIRVIEPVRVSNGHLQEYAAHLIIPLSNIISAVEIDPISKSKSHCMQIIAEEKNYRFCALSEDALAQWLGALKSHLARKKDASYSKNPQF